MKIQNMLTWISFNLPIFLILISQNESHAIQTQPILDNFTFDNFLNKSLQWRNGLIKFQGNNKMKLSASNLLAAAFCFISASISSAGGIGGGGLYIPILTIVAGFDLKTASTLSAFMVTGGATANVLYNLGIKSNKLGGKSLIDYDIALLSEPCMLLGVSIGVICNLVFPEWLITVLFAIFLAWSTTKTCKNGIEYWKIESENQDTYEKLEIGGSRNESFGQSPEIKSLEEPMVGSIQQGKEELRFPWKKLGVLIMVWFSFSAIYLLRGNRYGQGIIEMKPCGVGYWGLSMFQIPLAIAFTAWILRRKGAISCQCLDNDQRVNKLTFPLMALLAGVLGGVFGIGGGMLISPLLLQVGVVPEVTAATCSFMVFFSSTMSAFQYLMVGMEHTETALIFSIICFIASLLGLAVVQKAIKEFGRASLIVFSIGTVMVLSTVLMTTFGALDVWKDYSSGRYMGFKLLC